MGSQRMGGVLQIIGWVLAAIVLTLASYVAWTQVTSRDLPVPAKPDGAIRIATHNVHYIVMRRMTEGPWSVKGWEARKEALDRALKEVDADVIAFQEMESFNFGDGSANLARDYLLEQNPEYEAGANGDWNTFPITQPIFFRRDRFEMLDQGWFFFSDTPDVIYSRTFNGSWPAFASWVKLRELETGKDLRVVNVHFEYRSMSNRVKSADLVIERMRPALDAGERVLLVGDLNVLRYFKTWRMLAGEGWEFLPVVGSTFHRNQGLHLFGAIDHIGLAGLMRAVGNPHVLRRSYDGVWPSDHYPVSADIVLD